MRTHLFIMLLAVATMTVFGQQYSRKPVTVGDDTFLPYLKGRVVDRIPENDQYSQKIFAILLSHPFVNAPQGYEVEAYSDGTGRILELHFMPYLLDEGETVRKPGSSISFYFNDTGSIFGQPLQQGIGEIYTLPVKSGDFMGYPIYEQEGGKAIAIYKGIEPLFLPVSQEAYLNALIHHEEQQQKEDGNPVSIDDNLKEIEKAYQELLKTDEMAAEELRKEIESFRKDIAQNNNTVDLISSYKKQLAHLSPVERKKQAYYALQSMERSGNFAGLDPDNETEVAQPLVKPDNKAPSKLTNGQIRLIVVKWKLSNDDHSSSPPHSGPQEKAGYALADEKMQEMLQNQSIWKQIIQEVE